MKCCLTIAGSDSGGNAGVQADLRAFHAYGVHGCTVFAALTAQNPFGVSAIHEVPPDFVAAQLDAVLGVYDIAALKTGMLSNAKSIEVVVERLSAYPQIKKVIDPVMIATSGARLIGEEAMRALVDRLLPMATILTPNIPEAEALLGGKGDHLAKALYEKLGCAVLVKGGHATRGKEAVDTLCVDGEEIEFALPWVENPVSTHGTGCTLAASLAAELALGRDLTSAVRGAKNTVRSSIERSFLVGDRCGVLGFPRC